MQDKRMNFTVTQVIATLAGVTGWALVIASFWTVEAVGFLGIMFGGLSAVLRVRSYVCAGVEAVTDRELNAFRLGQDSVRSLRPIGR